MRESINNRACMHSVSYTAKNVHQNFDLGVDIGHSRKISPSKQACHMVLNLFLWEPGEEVRVHSKVERA